MCDGTEFVYQYDAYGNLLDDGSSQYTYDAALRLKTVTKDGMTTSYTYNGDGDRVSQTVGTTTTTYVLDIATPLTMVLAETTGTDTIRYLHGLDLVAQSDGTSTEYFAYDGLGSVRQVLDAAGQPLMTQTFDPYGSPYSYTGPTESATSYGFTGEQTDSNGLVFLRARYYAPSMGRFVQMDPSRQEQNLYQYSLSNPVVYTDPSGEQSVVCSQWPTYLRLQDLCMRANVSNDGPDALDAREDIYRTFVAMGIYVWMWPGHGGDSFLAASAMLSHFLDGGGSTKTVSPDVAFVNDPGIVRATRGFGGSVGPDTNAKNDEPNSLLPLLVVYIQTIQNQIIGQGPFVFSNGIQIPASSARYSPSNSSPRARALGYWAAYGHVPIGGRFTSKVGFDCNTNGYLVDYKARFEIEDRYEWRPGWHTPFYVPQQIWVPHDWALSLTRAGRANEYDYAINWEEKGTVWISQDFSTYRFIREPFEGFEPDPWTSINDMVPSWLQD